MNIHDISLIDLKVHEDDGGVLFEIIHKSDGFVSGQGQEMQQAYIVGDRIEKIVGAFHKHDELHDWFCILKAERPIKLILS
jgi:dTDP-4-dehydrorhamnose 3,5-epimerase-like enzyme